MKRACFCRPKAMASSVAVSQACSAVTMSMRAGNCVRLGRLGHRQVQKRHALKAQPLRQFARLLHQFRARLDAVDAPLRLLLEKQVVQDEAQVRLAGAVVGQGDAARADRPAPAAASR